MIRTLAALILGLCCASACARPVAGVGLDDSVATAGTMLHLNGAGLRSEFAFFSVYVGALYLAQPSSDAQAIIQSREPRRMLLVMKRNVDAERMIEAFHKGIAANLSPDEVKDLQTQLDELDRIMRTIGAAKEDDRIAIDFGGQGGLGISVNDQAKGAIPGPAIGPALLRVWLGAHPVQDSLKSALLGQ